MVAVSHKRGPEQEEEEEEDEQGEVGTEEEILRGEGEEEAEERVSDRERVYDAGEVEVEDSGS